MKFAIAYAVTTPDRGITEVGQKGAYRDEKSAIDAINRLKKVFFNAGYPTEIDEDHSFVATKPGEMRVYWLIRA